MALTGWGASNYLQYAGAVLTTAPLTMACYVNGSGFSGAARTMMALMNSASASDRNQFKLRYSSVANALQVSISDGGGADTAVASAAWTDSISHSCIGVFDTAAISVYMDGANKGTTATARTPSGVNRTAIGKQANAANDSPLTTGTILGWAAIWNVAFTDADAAALAALADPRLIRPSALVAFWPLSAGVASEPDICSATSVLAVQGSLSLASNPPIYLASPGE